MTEDETSKEIWRAAQSIKAHPERFKVCGVCESLVQIGVAMCPACGAYHFDGAEASVVARAEFRVRQGLDAFATLPRV